MQAASDIFLGWHRSRAGAGSAPYDFYIRQLRDWKASADIATMTPAAMRAYGQLCGLTLARAHARPPRSREQGRAGGSRAETSEAGAQSPGRPGRAPSAPSAAAASADAVRREPAGQTGR
jgi:Uncharacterized protein conserved in bacteria (DUF2252)